jgi:hypothetical protein
MRVGVRTFSKSSGRFQGREIEAREAAATEAYWTYVEGAAAEQQRRVRDFENVLRVDVAPAPGSAAFRWRIHGMT